MLRFFLLTLAPTPRYLRSFTLAFVVVAAIGVALSTPAVGQTANDPEAAPQTTSTTRPALGLRTARVVDGERVFSAPYVRGLRGPLVALEPLVAAWRGELKVGPLGERHELKIADQRYLFGPESTQLAVNGEMVRLSQPPQSAVGGIHVPLDFLDLTFSALGIHFEWQEQPPTLIATRGGGKVFEVRPSVTSFGEVTTVVLEFNEPSRYRIETSDRQATVSFYGDRVNLSSDASGGHLEGLRAAESAIILQLAAQTEVRHYTLDTPFRLVIDLVPGEATSELGDRGPSTFVPPQRGRGPFTIVIDPGHGGASTGAQGRSGVEEKAITLQVARTLSDRLRGTGARILLTRSDDRDLALTDRTAIANHEQADLFISLHVNSSFGRTARGAETFFLSLEASDEDAAELAAREDEADTGTQTFNNDLEFILWDLAQSHHLAESQRLAKLVQAEFNSSLGLRDRGVKQAPFRVLRGANMPAVLVELGFISNPDEERNLQDPTYQRRLVDTLVRAIQAYRVNVPSEPSQPASDTTKDDATAALEAPTP